MNSDGYPIATTFPDGATADALVSLDETANIALGDGTISFNATTVEINGVPIVDIGNVFNPMLSDLNANDFDILNAGTILATSFVKNGGTSEQYLMADGSSLKYSANSGNSNFYLYNNGTGLDPTPATGFITYNTTIQDEATFIYISHRTRDDIDIEVFFKTISQLNDVYIQDQSDSANSILYNISGPPVIVEQAQITIPVNRLSSFGTGITSFGNGHNILLSFFSNSIEVDSRLTNLEGRVQNITAIPETTNILRSVVNTLDFGDSFEVKYNDMSPVMAVNNATVNVYRPLETIKITSVGFIEGTKFIKTGGSPFDFLMADGTVTRPENNNGNRVNLLYYDVINGVTTFSLSMESWRYLSWGYIAPSTVSTVDCVSTLMTHQGGSLAITGINAGIAPKGYKIRVGSNVSATANGATSGWLGAAVQNFILPQAGWYIKIGFSLDATAGGTNNRTMIGLFQSNTRPVLDNTTTIASVVTGSMGIVQEKGETTFSFNTRGPSGSTKIPTTISSETPNNNWYTLEMINEARFAKVTLILTSQTPDNTQTATTSFICGQPNTMPITTAWVHLQQSMASPGGINNSAFLALGNITMKLAQ